jgi:hypothetical protein
MEYVVELSRLVQVGETESPGAGDDQVQTANGG